MRFLINHKFLTAAVALLLSSGCSKYDAEEAQTDRIGSQGSGVAADKAAISGVSPAVPNAEALVATFNGNNGEGWFDDDSIRIYRLGSMHYNAYRLSDGKGSGSAVFTRFRGNDDYTTSSETLYALTSCKYLYGISATDDGQAKLNVTIPTSLSIGEVGAPDGSTRQPVPYWGTATFGTDGRLTAAFNSMIPLLHIDTSMLPPDTRAVVLTSTYYPVYLNGEMLDDGDGEPVSGTFEALLKQGTRLTANTDFFYTYDSLRVNFDDESPVDLRKNLYIPIASTSYKKLHVIAVTGDIKGGYRWKGSLLKTFTPNTPFDRNIIVPLQESTGIKSPTI